jgi:hypothetical protein
MACPLTAFPTCPRLKRSPTSTPIHAVCCQARHSAPLTPVTRPYLSGRGVLLCPPCTESPFAPSRHYLSRSSVNRCLGQHYPALLVTQGSCAGPTPSRRLRFPSACGSLQVAASPRWTLALPDVISANLSLRVWTPTPAAPVVHIPVSSHKTTAFPALGPGRRSTTPGQPLLPGAYFEAAVIRSCSGPQICSPSRWLLPQPLFGAGQPGLLRSRLSRFVTSPSREYASRPLSGN